MGEKKARKGKGKGGGGGERACRQTFEAAIPPSCRTVSKIVSCQSISRVSNTVFCSVLKQSEMELEPHCRFCKKSLISGKRINKVPVFDVSRNNTLLVDCGQDSVVLAQVFESLRFSP